MLKCSEKILKIPILNSIKNIKMPEASKTRSHRGQEEEENLVQRVIEKIFTSQIFLTRLADKISEEVSNRIMNKVGQLEERLQKLEMVLEDQEQYSRRSNIRIYGVAEVCRQHLGVDVVERDIDVCHRLKTGNGATGTIIVRFCRRHTINLVLSNKKRLKGTKIVIREDLTKQRVAVYRRACERFSIRSVWTSDGKIVCKVGGKLHKITSFMDLEKIQL